MRNRQNTYQLGTFYPTKRQNISLQNICSFLWIQIAFSGTYEGTIVKTITLPVIDNIDDPHSTITYSMNNFNF